MTTPIPSADDAVVVRAADAETLAIRTSVTIRLLTDAAATGHVALSAVRVTLAEGVDGAAPHHHAGSVELFYVIDGQVQVLVGGIGCSLLCRATCARGAATICPTPSARRRGTPPICYIVCIVIAAGRRSLRILPHARADRLRHGAPNDVLLAEQDRYDTWFLESTVWQEARRPAGPLTSRCSIGGRSVRTRVPRSCG